MSGPPAADGETPRWLPPADGSEWRVAPGAPTEERYGAFAPPRPGTAVPPPAQAPPRPGTATLPPARPATGATGPSPRSRAAEDPALPVNGKAIAAIVLAVCGLVVAPFVTSLAAIVLGSLARGEIERDRRTRGARLANLGILAGAVGIAIWVVFLVVVAAGRGGGG